MWNPPNFTRAILQHLPEHHLDWNTFPPRPSQLHWLFLNTAWKCVRNTELIVCTKLFDILNINSGLKASLCNYGEGKELKEQQDIRGKVHVAKHFTAQVDRAWALAPFPVGHFHPGDLFSAPQGALRNCASQQLRGHLIFFFPQEDCESELSAQKMARVQRLTFH